MPELNYQQLRLSGYVRGLDKLASGQMDHDEEKDMRIQKKFHLPSNS